MLTASKPKFIYDEAGNKTEVIMALTDFEKYIQLLEDAEDTSIFEERRHEKTVPWESGKANFEQVLNMSPNA